MYSFASSFGAAAVLVLETIFSFAGSFGAAVTLVTQGKESANLRLIEVRCQTSIQLLPGLF